MRPNVTVIPLSRNDGRYCAALAWALRSEYPAAAASHAEFLHPRESLYFQSLEAERRKRSYLLGRCAAKRALVEYSDGLDPTAVEIAPGVFQYPVVQPALASPTGVSIAHSESVACAVAYSELHPLAIDVEDLVPDRSEIMRSQILPRELEMAGGAPHACAMIWTAKEALSKILRTGMTCPYSLLAVKDLDGRGGAFENFGQYRFETWITETIAVSIVLPRNSRFESDLAPVFQTWR
jgi:4'-phosphopantetheinyl transferase